MRLLKTRLDLTYSREQLLNRIGRWQRDGMKGRGEQRAFGQAMSLCASPEAETNRDFGWLVLLL